MEEPLPRCDVCGKTGAPMGMVTCLGCNAKLAHAYCILMYPWKCDICSREPEKKPPMSGSEEDRKEWAEAHREFMSDMVVVEPEEVDHKDFAEAFREIMIRKVGEESEEEESEESEEEESEDTEEAKEESVEAKEEAEEESEVESED